MSKSTIGQGSVFYNKARDNWTVLYYETELKTGEKKRKSRRTCTHFGNWRACQTL